MNQELNYKHLYYFWVTAKEGGMSHAADRLGLAVQTVSAQVRLLEQSLGHALFKPAGRGLALTDAGQAALQVAEQIFHLGEHLQTAVREAGTHVGVRLVVGISDGLPKLAVRDLLEPDFEHATPIPLDAVEPASAMFKAFDSAVLSTNLKPLNEKISWSTANAFITFRLYTSVCFLSTSVAWAESGLST